MWREVTRIGCHALCGLPQALVFDGFVEAVALATGSGVPDAAAERVAYGQLVCSNNIGMRAVLRLERREMGREEEELRERERERALSVPFGALHTYAFCGLRHGVALYLPCFISAQLKPGKGIGSPSAHLLHESRSRASRCSLLVYCAYMCFARYNWTYTNRMLPSSSSCVGVRSVQYHVAPSEVRPVHHSRPGPSVLVFS